MLNASFFLCIIVQPDFIGVLTIFKVIGLRMKQRLVEKEHYTMNDLLEIMVHLRRDCPWDAKQTHQTLKQYLLEETYEVLETIDLQEWEKFPQELGDLLLQIVFHSQIGAEEKRFGFDDVVNHICKKLIERHPHVFGDVTVHSADEVQNNWEHNKVKTENRRSVLSGVPQQAPALLQAQRLQEKAATVGFDWKTLQPVLDKFEEEWREFRETFADADSERMEHELGDVLFSLVNIGRFLGLVAEDALRKTNEKFIRRFQYIEAQYNRDTARMKQATLKELDHFWDEAKKTE